MCGAAALNHSIALHGILPIIYSVSLKKRLVSLSLKISENTT